MSNKCKIIENSDGQRIKDHIDYSIDSKLSTSSDSYFGGNNKFVTTSEKSANCKQKNLPSTIISGHKKPLTSNLTDADYDSSGPKQQTDESSPDEDDQSGSSIIKSNHIILSTRSKDFNATNRIRGILKYPPGWTRRTLSESDAPLKPGFHHSISEDYGYYGTSLESSPEILLDCFDYDGCSIEDLNKPKKCVTISDKTTTYVFRPNSSILGRRMKNQKKAQKKKERELKKLSSSPSANEDDNDNDDVGDCLNKKTNNDDIEAIKNAIEWQRNGCITSYDEYDDSSTDVSCCSSSSGCSDTSASDCSADETNPGDEEPLNSTLYEEENNVAGGNQTNKSKRKNRRKRNRKNKMNMKTFIETGGYDSD